MDLRQLDNQYFEWLYRQVADPNVEASSLSYRQLLLLFFRTEFVWLHGVEKDERRIKDGKTLRYEFIRSESPVGVPPEWMNIGCSMLELMIGLARHLSDMVEGEPQFWFWKLVENIGLRHYTDDVLSEDNGEILVDENGDIIEPRIDPDGRAYIEETLTRIIFRRYNYAGEGGLFPLKEPDQDQRRVELWYQMSAYVLENYE